MNARIAAVCLLLGCGPVANEPPIAVRWFPEDEFERDVMPVLSAKCANPSCHGRPERPLSLYSPMGWRKDPRRTYQREPLSSAELVHNYRVSCVLASVGDTPLASPFLLKPLGDRAGTYHGGGEIFEGVLDREYRTLRAWIAAGDP